MSRVRQGIDCCTCCREMLRKRLQDHIVENPHPAASDATLAYFKMVVRAFGMMFGRKRDTAKKCHCCANMSTNPPTPYPHYYRVELLWCNPYIAHQLKHKWYNKLLAIDQKLQSAAVKLFEVTHLNSKSARTLMDTVADGICQRMENEVVVRETWKLSPKTARNRIYANRVADALAYAEKCRADQDGHPLCLKKLALTIQGIQTPTLTWPVQEWLQSAPVTHFTPLALPAVPQWSPVGMNAPESGKYPLALTL